jgi:hypothetical protein
MFPHFADGGGWTTQVILVNPGDQVLTGSLQFLSQGSGGTAGQPVIITNADGNAASSFSYSIPAHSAFRLRTAGNSPDVRVGSVRLTPDATSGTPSGVSVLSFRNGGVTVTEAGIPAIRATSAFRLYAETSGDFVHSAVGSIQTGIAVANSSATAATVNFDLTNLDGTPSGLSSVLTVFPNGQSALFLNQIPGFAALPASFQGILRISSTANISVLGLRGRYNERGDFLLTTTPAVAEDEPAPVTETVIPHVIEGGGYTTQFILFSGRPGQASSGTLRFLDQTGQAMLLSIR